MVIIRVKNISKKYKISLAQENYLTLRDVLAKVITKPISLFKTKEDFWALRDINFIVEKGEAIGIIGANGAGKSTLLKILSRITTPTTGEIRMDGRVSALLEVGTGFHQELSGRENVFLNGAMLGMSKKEIVSKFDDIVNFAGVEKFIDVPIKRYSSGMSMRLAFSIAAHLEPEILLIDEVLAVGDAEFQKRSLGKMNEVTKQAGRTIFFVSHNLTAVSNLCTRGIILQQGKIVFDGDVHEAIRIYTNKFLTKQTEWRGEIGDESAKLIYVWVKSLDPEGYFHTASDVEVGMELNILRPLTNLICGFILFSEWGHELAYTLYDDLENAWAETIRPGKFLKRFIIPADTLAQGTYRIEFDVGIHMMKKIAKQELVFSLDNVKGIGRRFSVALKGRSGLFRPPWPVQ